MTFSAAFMRSMQEWVEEQKRILELAKKSMDSFKDADRLALLIAARTACQHISRTIKGFENWLNNPAITTVMPQSMLKEIQEKIWKIMIELIEFDAKHTSDFLNYIKDKEKISTIPSLLLREEREERTPPYSL
ncbi:MAG: DUF2153 family protein [Thermoproteota archaeon]|jgi:hypothetical protein|nr:DUF2153 family protein [Thermoproteota archaeon]